MHVRACIYVCILAMQTVCLVKRHVLRAEIRTRICIWTYICIYAASHRLIAHICMNMRAYTYTYICMHIHTYVLSVHSDICMHVWECTHMNAYTRLTSEALETKTFVCMYIHISICIWDMHLYPSKFCICMQACMHEMHAYTHINTCTHIHIHIYISYPCKLYSGLNHNNMRVYVCMCVCIYIYIYMYMYMYMYIYVCMYIYMYTHTYILPMQTVFLPRP